jgi:23S rRNA pseudouridine1911/1915/1917 synthase
METTLPRYGKIDISALADGSMAGMRVDQAAARLFSDFSRSRLQKWIRDGSLAVDGRAVKTTFRLAGGETLRLRAVAEPLQAVVPQDIPLNLLYADDDLLVIDKPAGLVVHPAAGNPDGTLQNGLLHYDPALDALPRSGIVHRLDKETTGVMVVARSLRAHTSLVSQLQARTMSRVYQALALGCVEQGGTVDAPIGRHPVDRKKMAVVPGGRPAVTHFRVMAGLPGATLLEVSLETGRTHQIRVHMAHLGHALAGDPVYGRQARSLRQAPADAVELLRRFPRQALHAWRLKLLHPADGREVVFEAPLPRDLAELLQSLGAIPR